MKKTNAFFVLMIMVSIMIFISGCNDKAKSGTVSSEQVELYSYIPDSATGLFTINFNKLTAVPAFNEIKEDMKFDKIGKEQKFFKGYADFVEKTGIDPKKDVKSVVVAIFGEIGEKEPDVSVIANLNYDKQKLLALLKESKTDFQATDFNGMTLYSGKDEKGKEGGFIFLSDNLITAGTINGVKKIASLAGTNGKNILSDPKMSSYMSKAGNSSIFSFAFRFPEKMKGIKGNSMVKADFSKAEAFYGNVDFSSNIWAGKFVLVSLNEEGNTNLVTTLNGLKGLGAMGGPEIAELINNINITASPDSIILSFKISSELLEKLKTKAEEKAGSFNK